MAEGFDFGHAIEMLKIGRRVARAGWTEKGMRIALQVPDDRSKMRSPYIYAGDEMGAIGPWVASHADMLAEDWTEV